MKKLFSKTLIFMLAAALLLSSALVSCGEKEAIAMQYGDETVTEGMYRYWLASYKGILSQSYSLYEDTASFWNTVVLDGKTVEEYYFETVMTNIKMTLVCMKLFDDYKLKMPNSTLESFDAYIEDLITELCDGNEKKFDYQLEKLGIDRKTLKNIYINEEKVQMVREYLYGDDAATPLTREQTDDYYEGVYARILHIYINDKYTFEKDENGYTKYDSNGKPIKVKFSEDELKKKNETIAKIDAGLENGEDFSKLYETYSEDREYDNGYYLTQSVDFVDEVVTATWGLEVGEWKKVESDVGVHYVLRLELEDEGYAKAANSDFFETFNDNVVQYYFNKTISALTADIIVEQSIIDKYNLRESPTNLMF